jgi:hypothetical protein
MSQNTLSEFNRLLHGVDLSEEDIEYDGIQTDGFDH